MAEDPKDERVESPQNSESNDADYEMTADMMVHDEMDDERTLDEEELIDTNEDFSSEVNNLQKEGEMPIEDLLALFGYDGDGEHNEVPLEEIRPQPLHPFAIDKDVTSDKKDDPLNTKEEDSRSYTSDGSRVSNAPSPNSQEENGYDPFQNQRITRGIASLHAQYFEPEDSTDDEYQPTLADEWKKEVLVGPEYQATVPDGLSSYPTEGKVYENDDKLLWKPDSIDNKQLKKYLSIIFSSPEGDMGSAYRDDEQALYLLLQCGNVEDSLKRRGEQAKLPPDVSLWSEEECRSFEFGLRIYGKDFRQIQRNKMSHRTVGEIVQFYYLWKKTERYDAFCTQTRFGKKKYGAPGIADYMDRFMDETESVVSSRSASPYSQAQVGESSPAEVTNEKQYMSSSSHQPTQSKSANHYQSATISGQSSTISNRSVAVNNRSPMSNNQSNTINNRPISNNAMNLISNQSATIIHQPAFGLTHSTSQSASSANRLGSGTHAHTPRITAPHSENKHSAPVVMNPSASNSFLDASVGFSTGTPGIKGTDVNLFSSSTNAFAAPNVFSTANVAAFHIPNHLATAISVAGLHVSEGLEIRGMESLANSGGIGSTWNHDNRVPILDPDIFGATSHVVYKANPNTVSQRTAAFAGGGYTTSSISQPVE